MSDGSGDVSAFGTDTDKHGQDAGGSADGREKREDPRS